MNDLAFSHEVGLSMDTNLLVIYVECGGYVERRASAANWKINYRVCDADPYHSALRLKDIE